jgi:hypothetical protein
MSDDSPDPLDPAGLIDALGGAAAVAQHFGVPYSTAASWKARNRLPDEHRPEFVHWAQAKGLVGVTFEAMVKMHAPAVLAPEATQ